MTKCKVILQQLKLCDSQMVVMKQSIYLLLKKNERGVYSINILVGDSYSLYLYVFCCVFDCNRLVIFIFKYGYSLEH